MINFKKFLKHELCLGVYIDQFQIAGVLNEQLSGAFECVDELLQSSDIDLLDLQNTKALEDALNQLLVKVSKKHPGYAIAVQVAIADPVIKTAVLSFDELPAGSAAQQDLMRLRFQKEFHLDMQAMGLAFQPLGEKMVYALAAPEDLIDTIAMCCECNGFELVVSDMASHYLINNFDASLQANAGLLHISYGYWSLLLWDARKRIVYTRSKRRYLQLDSLQGDELEKTMQSMFVEVERLLHSANIAEGLDRLYIVAAGLDESAVNSSLQQGNLQNTSWLAQSCINLSSQHSASMLAYYAAVLR